MNNILKLVNKSDIEIYIQSAISEKKTFLVTPHDIDCLSKFFAIEVQLRNSASGENLEVVFQRGLNEFMSSNLNNEKLSFKDESTGLFFRSSIKFNKYGSAFITIPKIINIKNSRAKNRIKLDPTIRCKISGLKKTNFSENIKFSGNLIDFHFNGLGFYVASNYISYFSINDYIEIRRIADTDIHPPLRGEVKFISKTAGQNKEQKSKFYRIGFFTKEKIPASIIFELNKLSYKMSA